jgi:hypothetical protein
LEFLHRTLISSLKGLKKLRLIHPTNATTAKEVRSESSDRTKSCANSHTNSGDRDQVTQCSTRPGPTSDPTRPFESKSSQCLVGNLSSKLARCVKAHRRA